ncbi:MAG: serine/threonine protein kinase [Verrucomicrobiaceae bacterium]|nr:MAG: serine/threonine protein kinase [Verrucomicrobiaceae bacterium]
MYVAGIIALEISFPSSIACPAGFAVTFSPSMSDSHEHVGFVAPEPADLAPLFPGYEIQSLIATGGMGAVYRAVQKSLDRTVALKILPMEFSNDAAFCAGFEAEAKAMARLNHPNLIGVFDFGEVGGMLFIIMEYVPGKSVYHAAYGQAIEQREVIRLVTGIANGLAHAHENGIIHRDIKPSNILLDLNNQPKIGDFGLARPAERKIEEGEEIFGTPHYTAPEVVNAPHTVDYRADIFSVGVLLHELLTSKLPADDPRPASAICQCDPRFDAIIKKATQPLAAARYSSAALIAKDLQAIGDSLQRGPRVAQVAAPRRAGSPRRTVVRQSSGSSTGVWLVIGAVVVLGAVFFFSRKPAEQKEASPTVVVIPKESEPSEPEPEKPGDTTPFGNPVPDSEKPPEDTASSSPFGGTEPPVVAQDAMPEDGNAAGTDENAAPPVAEPKFDVSGFFVRARKIMQDRAKTPLAAYRTNLNMNFSDFQRAAEKQTRKLKLSGAGDDGSIAKAISKMGETSTVPEELDSSLAAMEDLATAHRACLARQTGIIDTLNQNLSQLSGTYVVGLEKQIERLRSKDDPGAIALIEKEIERTKESPEYFSALMLGKDPDSASGAE